MQHLGNGFIRFLAGQHFLVGPGPAHTNESLPAVTVESDTTLCSRMSHCDFRFPLPRGARVAGTDPVTGGFDTIKGKAYVTNIAGGMVDLHAYAGQMWRDGFSVNEDEIGFTASSPDGGFVEAYYDGDACAISFSFFGDY